MAIGRQIFHSTIALNTGNPYSFEKLVPACRTLIIDDRVPQRRFCRLETYKVFQCLVRVNRSGPLTRPQPSCKRRLSIHSHAISISLTGGRYSVSLFFDRSPTDLKALTQSEQRVLRVHYQCQWSRPLKRPMQGLDVLDDNNICWQFVVSGDRKRNRANVRPIRPCLFSEDGHRPWYRVTTRLCICADARNGRRRRSHCSS